MEEIKLTRRAAAARYISHLTDEDKTARSTREQRTDLVRAVGRPGRLT